MRTKAERDAARALESKATAAPWQHDKDDDANPVTTPDLGWIAHGIFPDDAAFIASARTHWPAAEAELDEAADLLERALRRSRYVCAAGTVHPTMLSSWHDSVETWLDEHRPDWRERLTRGAPAGYTGCDGSCGGG